MKVIFYTKFVGTFLADEEFHLPLLEVSRVIGREGTKRRRWERLKAGENNGNLPRKNLYRMQCARAIPVARLGSGSC
jgi:hypothetical protein